MIYLTKDLIDLRISELTNYKELEFNIENYTFNYKGATVPIFPAESKNWLKVMDQLLMTGHYLYGKNPEFRQAFLAATDGRELNINYNKKEDIKVILTRNVFNTLLYGLIAGTYLKSLPDTPIHYFARPIADEKNPSLDNFLEQERQENPKYRRMDGTPFYNYIMKKSYVMNPNTVSPVDRVPATIICPIKNYVPEIRKAAEYLYTFASEVYKVAFEYSDPSFKAFLKSFVDESWSPYLKAL